VLVDDEGVPVGWEYVTLGADLGAFCDAAEAGDMEAVNAIVERAYERAYARLGGEILAAEKFS
jgi:hypothetical protein